MPGVDLRGRARLAEGGAGAGIDRLKAEGRDVSLKIFSTGETAATQGHADNPTLANEYIFDWVATRLGINAL
jgi:hypothetical protein